MAHPEGKRATEEERERPEPGVGTDPARTPQEDDDGHHRVVSPDEEKVREHEREQEERRENETEEEQADRIKRA